MRTVSRSKVEMAVTVTIVTMLALFTFCERTYADTTVGDTPAEEVMWVQSANDLADTLSRAGSTEVPTVVKLVENSDGYTVNQILKIADKTTLDLNGQILRTDTVQLIANEASITNGTLYGDIVVRADDPDGYIKDMKILDADDTAIYLYGGTIGDITNNTIRNAGGIAIRIFGGAKAGDITNNTIIGAGYHGISLNGSSGSSNGGTAGDIAYNTIKNCKGDGISLYHASHCKKITHNTLTTIGGHDEDGDFGIIINNGGKGSSYAKEITYNTVSNVSCASIVVFCKTGKSYVKGDIAYNTVNNSSTKKKGINWDKGSKLACEAAIYVDNHAQVKGDICNNEVNTSYDNGICVLDHSSVNNIKNNKVNNAANAGISVTSNSTVNGTISKNKVSKSKRYGIFVNNNSKVVGKITGNIVKASGINGLFFSKKATAGVVTNNTITGSKMYGVIAGDKSKVKTLSNNTIAMSSPKAGMAIISNTNCYIKNITKNKISGKYNCGIRVKFPTGKVNVLSNTLKAGNPKSKKIDRYVC